MKIELSHMRCLPIRRLSIRHQSSLVSAPIVSVHRLAGKDSGIILFSLFRPETRNAINSKFLNLLDDAINAVEKDPKCRAVIVKSDLNGTFCAGADLKERAALNETETKQFVRRTRGLIHKLSTMRVPVIAAIDGIALGGGLEIALACDIRVGANTAKMGLVETKLGIIPGAGGTQRLSRLIGPSLAKELMFTARILDGVDAYKIRILNYVVQQNSAEEAAYEKSLQIAREILPQGPIAVQMVKKAVNTGVGLDLDTGLQVEDLCYAQVVPTKDRLEGLKAFKEKRAPIFLGE